MRVQNRIIYIRLTIHEIWLMIVIQFNRTINEINTFFQMIGGWFLDDDVEPKIDSVEWRSQYCSRDVPVRPKPKQREVEGSWRSLSPLILSRDEHFEMDNASMHHSFKVERNSLK